MEFSYKNQQNFGHVSSHGQGLLAVYGASSAAQWLPLCCRIPLLPPQNPSEPHKYMLVEKKEASLSPPILGVLVIPLDCLRQ